MYPVFQIDWKEYNGFSLTVQVRIEGTALAVLIRNKRKGGQIAADLRGALHSQNRWMRVIITSYETFTDLGPEGGEKGGYLV